MKHLEKGMKNKIITEKSGRKILHSSIRRETSKACVVSKEGMRELKKEPLSLMAALSSEAWINSIRLPIDFNVFIHFSNVLFSKESENNNRFFEKNYFKSYSTLKLFISYLILKKTQTLVFHIFYMLIEYSWYEHKFQSVMPNRSLLKLNFHTLLGQIWK